jgi:DNA-directed RNA polymerase subunit K/omega
MKNKITYDQLLKAQPNKYKLAITVGKRYGQLVAGEAPVIAKKKKDTLFEIASKEVVEGRVKLIKVKKEVEKN